MIFCRAATAFACCLGMSNHDRSATWSEGTALLITMLSPQALAATLRSNSTASSPSGGERQPWTDETRAELGRALDQRVDHGLDRISLLSEAPANEGEDARDDRYTQAALGYAGVLARGQVDPATLHDVYALARPVPDLRTGLRRALAKHRLAPWLASLAPQDDEYCQLSKAYRSYRAAAARGEPREPIASPEAIHVGDVDPHVTAIASNSSMTTMWTRRRTTPTTGSLHPGHSRRGHRLAEGVWHRRRRDQRLASCCTTA